jgi:succinoglycan biosynthesis transport protein ExoP
VSSPADALTFLDLWKIVRRRRLTIIGVTALLLGLAIVDCVFSTRRYQSTGEIQVQKDSSDALGLDSLMGGETASGGDALEGNVTLQTQAKILESQTLGLQVIDQLKLENTEDFKPHFSTMGWVLGLISPKGVPDSGGAGLMDSPSKRDHMFGVFRSNTKVAPVAGTRLIDVSYTSSDPKVAAAAVNNLIESLVDYNFETRYKATSQASEWLGKQLSDLRVNSEQLQSRVANLQRDSGVFTFGGEDIQGKGIAYSTVLDQLQQATTNLTQAQTNRVVRGALYQAAKAGDPDMISGLSSSSLVTGASPGVTNSLALLQTLRSDEATQRAQISETAAKFGPAYPKLDEMKAHLMSLQQSIHAEQSRLQSQAKSDYLVAEQVEGNMRQIFQEQKKGAEALNNKAIQYEILHQEADESRTLYERLLSRLKEAGVLEGLRSSNITVVEPGRVPSRPSKPNVKMFLTAGLLGGALLGVCLAFVLEMMDSKIREVQIVQQRYGDALFGELPYERHKQQRKSGDTHDSQTMFTLMDPTSHYSEALRALRTAILLSRGGSPPKVLLITSSVPGEGKSTLATNLASLLAQQGKRVLLIDADLRRPSLHHLLGLPNHSGLSTLLTSESAGEASMENLVSLPGIPGLRVLPAGPIPPYPAEILGSPQMSRLIEAFSEHFDFVMLDSAPVLAVTDAVVLSAMSDLALLLARQGVTERAQLDKSFRLIRMRSPDVSIGIVLNAIRQSEDPYAYNYAYGYGKTPRKGAKTS